MSGGKEQIIQRIKEIFLYFEASQENIMKDKNWIVAAGQVDTSVV